MRLLFVGILLLGNAAFALQQPTETIPAHEPSATAVPDAKGLRGNDLMALPPGKSTVIGGTISSVDPVMDELVLKVFGGKRMKILFDERTQVYRDGAKTSLRDLHANEHASMETMLDGTTIFARSIHMLSQSPEGECQGQVVGYDPGSGVLTVNSSLSHDAIKLQLPSGVPIVREGQTASSSARSGTAALVPGALITATFQSDNKGQGVANRVAILAAPGDQLSFSGNISFLDLSAHQFVVVDEGNNQDYKISFDPSAFPISKDLHEGTHVKVTAEFDGSHYAARTITVQ
jgi:hypothetical protein